MRALFAVLVLLLPAACEKTADLIGDKVPAQMSRYQDWTAAGNWKAIVAEPVVDCKDEPEACGKLHGTRGNACLTLAMAARTDDRLACPGVSPDVTAWLDCASGEFTAAAPLVAADSRPGTLANAANALYCRAATLTPRTGQNDAVRAEQAGTKSDSALGLLWAARGALFQSDPSAGAAAMRCSAVNRSSALAVRGQSMADQTTASALAALQIDIKATRASIPACSP